MRTHTLATTAAVGPLHSSLVFDTALTGQSLTIRFDSTNLGNHSDDIGIDNIVFRQSIPAPSAVALLGLSELAADAARPNRATTDQFNSYNR